MRFRTVKRCYAYKETKPMFGGGFGVGIGIGGIGFGGRRKLQTMMHPADLWPSHVGTQDSIPQWIAGKGATSSTFKVTVTGSGQMNEFSKYGVTQSFSAGGEVSFTKPKGQSVQFDMAAKTFIKFTMAKEQCYGSGIIGVLGLALHLEAALNMKPDAIEALGSGQLEGYAQAKANIPSTNLWATLTNACTCADSWKCRSVAGASVWGKLEVKLAPFTCHQQIQLSLTGEVGFRFSVGSLGVEEKFSMNILNPTNVGVLKCV